MSNKKHQQIDKGPLRNMVRPVEKKFAKKCRTRLIRRGGDEHIKYFGWVV